MDRFIFTQEDSYVDIFIFTHEDMNYQIVDIFNIHTWTQVGIYVMYEYILT